MALTREEIVKNIAKDFRVGIKGNPKIRPLQKKLIDGVATYTDADIYAMETAKSLGKALADNLRYGALTPEEYKSVVSEVLPAGLESTYNTVSDYAASVQRGINDYNDIKLGVIKPKMDKAGAAKITKKAMAADDYEAVAGAVNVESQNFAQNVATKMMKDNAGFQQNVGYNITVERKYDDVGVHNRKDPCQWCLDKEGVWEYGDALANGVFERHPGCGCTIIYYSKKGPQIQTDWRSNTWENL